MNRKLRYAILSADLLWIASVFLAQFLWSGQKGGTSVLRLVDLTPALAAIAVWILLYFSKRLDCFGRGWHLPSVCAQVTVAVCCLIGALLATAFFAKYNYSIPVLVYIACFLPIGFVGIRGLVFMLVTSRSAGSIKRRVVILGAGRRARELSRKISVHPEMSMEVVGLLFPSGAGPHTGPATLPSAISLRSLNVVQLLRENNVQELIVVEPLPPGPEAAKVISNCRDNGMRIHLVPQHFELYLAKAELTEIEDVPLLSLAERKVPLVAKRAKRCIDVVGAFALLVLAAPLLVSFAAALFTKKGKPFKRELRSGKEGAPFWMYRLNIERDSKHLQGYARILAKLSVTELPQLWNVLKGEMSLVGPRPESEDRVRHYTDWQRQRLTVVPGLTGLAQVRGLREEHSSEEKARFDLQYISQWSLFLDLSLLLQTAWALFARTAKVDSCALVPTPNSNLAGEFVTRRMMHADSTQPGAD